MSSPKAHKRQKNIKEGENKSGSKSPKSSRSKSTRSSSVWETVLMYDTRCTKALSLCATPDSSLGYLRPLMKLLEISCHGVPWLIGTIVVFVCVHKPEDIEILVNLFLGLIFDLIVVGVLKALCRRQRPNNNQMDMFATVSVDQYSFPSGHTTRAAMLTCFFIERVLENRLPVALLVVWSACVSMSRILLGRHHVVDVLSGFLIGIMEYVAYSQFWLPQEKCLDWLETYLGHVHL